MSKTQERIDPRVLRTRKLLRDAFTALAAEKPFEEITAQDIAERATLNRATFYLHYRDKNDFLIRSMQEVLGEMENNIVTPEIMTQSLNADTIITPLVAVFQHFAQHANFYYVMLCEIAAPPAINEIQHYIEKVALRWMAQLQPDKTRQVVDARILLKFIATAYIGVLRWWLDNGMPYSPQQMAQQFLDLISNGVFRSIGMAVPS